MAKANLTLSNGTIVAIEGTAEEVALLLAKVSGDPAPTGPSRSTRARRERKAGPSKNPAKPVRKGPQALMHDLVTENWFKSKRTIGDVQKKLEEKGHIYAIVSLSTPLLRLTRSRILRRIKEKTGWVYVT